MFSDLIKAILFLLVTLSLMQCNAPEQDKLFRMMPSSETHINFNNKLTENDSVNFLMNQYIYIGAGVGAGDFNNDGLQDLFFCRWPG